MLFRGWLAVCLKRSPQHDPQERIYKLGTPEFRGGPSLGHLLEPELSLGKSWIGRTNNACGAMVIEGQLRLAIADVRHDIPQDLSTSGGELRSVASLSLSSAVILPFSRPTISDTRVNCHSAQSVGQKRCSGSVATARMVALGIETLTSQRGRTTLTTGGR